MSALPARRDRTEALGRQLRDFAWRRDGRTADRCGQLPVSTQSGRSHERPVSGVPISLVAGKSVCDSLCDMHYSEVTMGVLAWSCLGNESMTPSQASFSAQ